MYLWCNVVRSATERLCKFAREDALLTHAKVGNFAMTVRIKQYVVQFQISVTHSIEQTVAVTDEALRDSAAGSCRTCHYAIVFVYKLKLDTQLVMVFS